MNIIDLDFVELIDLEKLKNIVKNFDSIGIKWGKRSERKDRDSQKAILKRYLAKMKQQGITSYNYAMGKDIGRLFVQGVGLQNIKKEIRATICSDFYKDIDLKNAQPHLLNEFCKKNKITANVLNEYCINRDKYYHLKQEIVEIIFGGEVQPLKDLNDYNFVSAMKMDLVNIQNYLINDPEHFAILKTLKKQKNENIGGRLLSWFLCQREAKILEHTLQWCVEKDIPIKNFVLIFDGFMCPKNIHIDLDELNVYIEQKIGHPIQFIEKSFPKSIEVESDATYQSLKKSFEQTHAKIINKSFYVQFETNENLIIYSETKLKVSFQHIQNDFLKIWLKDPEIKCYKDLGVYPNPENCPDDIFNTWKPFYASTLPDATFNQDDLDFMLNHVKILCNHETIVYEHFIRWIGFILQYPEQKTIMPVIVSDQGAGKGSLLEMMRAILGTSKVLDTSKPSQYVWGQFNGQMEPAYLVCLNELCKKEMEGAEGWFKALASDPYILINKKGIESFELESFHKFIAFSNGEDPYKTTADDRRGWVIKASSELCINHQNKDDPKNEYRKKYWDRFYLLLKDESLIRALYNHFMSVECKNFKSMPIPRTEYHQELLEANEPMESLFIKNYILSLEQPIVQIQCMKLYKKFEEFMKQNGTEYSVKFQRFNFRLKQMKIDGMTTDDTGKYHYKNIDTNKARKHFGYPQIDFIPTGEYETD